MRSLCFFLSGCIKHGQKWVKSFLLVMFMSPHGIMTASKLPPCSQSSSLFQPEMFSVLRAHSWLVATVALAQLQAVTAENIEMPCASSFCPIASRKCHQFREQITLYSFSLSTPTHRISPQDAGVGPMRRTTINCLSREGTGNESLAPCPPASL